jgi:hypothetical protein
MEARLPTQRDEKRQETEYVLLQDVKKKQGGDERV